MTGRYCRLEGHEALAAQATVWTASMTAAWTVRCRACLESGGDIHAFVDEIGILDLHLTLPEERLMKVLKYIAKNRWLRILVAGLASGGLVCALMYGLPLPMTWIAVAAAALIGAVYSFGRQTMVQATVVAIIIFILLAFMPAATRKLMEKARSLEARGKAENRDVVRSTHSMSWKGYGGLAFFGLLFGVPAGMGVGMLLGAACRLTVDPPVYGDEPAGEK